MFKKIGIMALIGIIGLVSSLGQINFSQESSGYWLLTHTEAIVPDDKISQDGSYNQYYDDSSGNLTYKRTKNLDVGGQKKMEVLEMQASWSQPPEVILALDVLSLNLSATINQFQRVNTNYSGMDIWAHWTLPSVKIGAAGADAALLKPDGKSTVKATISDGVISKSSETQSVSKSIGAGKASDIRVLNIVINSDGIMGYRYTYEWTVGDASSRFSYENLLDYLKNRDNRIDIKNTLSTSQNAFSFRMNEAYRAQNNDVTFESLRECFHSDMRFIMILRGIAPTPKTFVDVSDSHWSSPYVKKASTYGFVSGVGDSKFEPQKSVTRAQFVAMIMNVMGAKPYAGDGLAFGDVKSGDWYYNAVGSAYEMGLLEAFDGRSFAPNQALTREEMASMLAGALNAEAIQARRAASDLNAVFSDVTSISNQFMSAVQAVYDTKLMGGKGQGIFDPKGLTTRAESAAVQLKLMEMLFGIME